MTVVSSQVFKPFTVESSIVNFKGRLIVLYSPRTPAEEYWLIVADYFTGERIAKVPNNSMMLGTALMVGSTLHFFGTTAIGSAGNSIMHMSTTDLVNWTAPTQVWVAGDPRQKIFNVSVAADPPNGRYIMAYETSEPYSGFQDYNVRFLSSQNLSTWSAYGGVFGSDRYVACPKLSRRSADGAWYMHYLVLENGQYKTRVAKAIDPSSTWVQSAYFAFVPTMPNDLTNMSDVDFCEFEGATYFVLCSGNQGDIMDLRQGYEPVPVDTYLGYFAQ